MAETDEVMEGTQSRPSASNRYLEVLASDGSRCQAKEEKSISK